MSSSRALEIGDYVRTRIAPGTAATSSSASATPEPVGNPIEQLKELGELRDAGVITAEEFEAKKAELLSRV